MNRSHPLHAKTLCLDIRSIEVCGDGRRVCTIYFESTEQTGRRDRPGCQAVVFRYTGIVNESQLEHNNTIIV